MLIPPVIFSFRSSSPSSHDHSSEAPRFVQTSLNNHNVVIFHCTACSKASLERSFFYLKRGCLVCKNLTWNNGVVIVWRPSLAKPTLWTDGGRHFLLVVAIVTRSLSNAVASTSVERASCLWKIERSSLSAAQYGRICPTEAQQGLSNFSFFQTWLSVVYQHYNTRSLWCKVHCCVQLWLYMHALYGVIANPISRSLRYQLNR